MEQYEAVRDELDYRRNRRELLKERIRQEDLLSEQQLVQANKSIERLNLSLDLLGRIVDSLEVRAPISGHLSSIGAELGQNVNPGQRIGQIDRLDKFKLRVAIDQFYIARVGLGTPGRFLLDGVSYPVEVQKIYPEVVNDTFQVDMAFVGEQAAGIKRGQSLTVELSFGEPARSLMVAKGGYFQQTSGRWVYLVAADGKTATRATIRLGRQNPRFVEVLEGLQDGDWIVTSGYDGFNEADELVFSEPIGQGQ